MDWTTLKSIDLRKIKTIDFPEDQYLKEVYTKRQICLHHTVGSSVDGVISSWEGDAARVAVCIVLDKEGIPWQLFSSRYWAYHLKAGNAELDKHSIAIEIVNWGQLIAGDGTVKQFGNPPKSVQTQIGKYYAYYGNSVTVPMQYYEHGFRGFNYFDKYTDAQIQTIGELLLYWGIRYEIPLTYNEDMWDLSARALDGNPGVWGHVSYRPAPAKSDPHPQPELIEMLKTLEGIA